MLGIFLVFLSACFFGFSNAYWKKAVAARPFLQIIFIRGMYSTLFFFFCCLVDYYSAFFQTWIGVPPVFNGKELGLSFALCLFSSFGLYFFVKSVKESPVSIVIPLSSINLFGLLTAVFVLGEDWRNSYSWAFLFVLMGIYFIYKNELQFNSTSQFFRALVGGLLASFFWGVSYALFKYPIAWLGVLRFTFLLEFSVTSMVGIMILAQKQSLQAISHQPIRILALCLILGSIFLHIAYQLTDITKIVFAGKFQLIISILVGKWLYREPIGLYRWTGIGFLLLSIYFVF